MSNIAYSKIQHLAHALFFKHNPHQRFLAMLTSYSAYFDTSGCRSSGEFLVTGGYIATVKKWNDFDRHWKSILKGAGVDVFHMTDFHYHYGDFKGDEWKLDNGHSANFLRKLVNAICKAACYAPAVLIYLDDWRTLNREYKLKEYSYTPLALAGTTCIGMIYIWCEQQNIPYDRVECFHEEGDEDKGTLKKIVQQWFGFDLPLKSKALTPLQACDLLAWEAAYAVKQVHTGPERKPDVPLRPSIEEILNRIECDPKQFTLDGWRKICRSQNIPKR